MLKFIGTGSAFNTKLGNNSAYIIDGEDLILIDCGSVNFHRIKESGLLEKVKNIHVYITHTHADHVGSLADLIFYMYYSLEAYKDGIINIEVISHPNVKIEEYLVKCGVEKDVHYELTEVPCGVHTHFGGTDYSFISYQTQHVDNLFSTGLMIGTGEEEDDIETCIYTGDTKYLNKRVVDILELQHNSKLYVDTCSEKYEGSVHLSLEELAEIIPQYLRYKVWCMHLDEKFDVEIAEELGFNVAEVEL